MTSSYREFDNFASMHDSSRGDGGFQNGGFSLQGLSNDIQLFNKNVSTLDRRITLLNTPQDNYALRQEIIEMVSDTAQLAKMARSSIDKAKDQLRSFMPPEKMQFDRLVSTFKNSVSRFQQIQQSTSDIEHEMLTKARSASMRKNSDSLPESEREGPSLSRYEVADQSFQSQRQAQISSDDTLALEQREREMHQLEHDILDINDIFRDLGTMVHEQGETIDNIESNVEVAAVRVESGNQQLESAVRHKRCSRKLTCVIVCVVSTVAVIVIIVAIILICTVIPGNVCSRR